MTCPVCHASVGEPARFCPACGASLAGAAGTSAEPPSATPRAPAPAADAPTLLPSTPRAGVTRPSATPRSGRDLARFAPGTLLGGRYQIASLLGRGGMGEVYRADDLVLGQSVALKFLPEGLVHDPDWLERLRSEVRAARQVSHPNVCRVYDIGEADGHTFVSMEYVAGEDLASLLRRIGRLAPDKAAEMARGLCAGLAAAHDRGVLHRDLKPANVLIDEQGRVRLADFGLAGGEPAEGGLVGTPAYMAPELFERKPATVESDIYALGLVLYEMFTGKPAFSGATVGDLARQHHETTPTRVTQLVAEIDPLADRIIQRCLAKDPAERPRSALAVAAALPGGDPLAAALAAGETPSPAMVAASGGVGALAPLHAAGLLAGICAALAVVVWLSARTQAVHYLPQARSPAVLEDTAAMLAKTLGYTDPVRDSASGFTSTDYITYLRTTNQSPDRWENLRAGQPPGVAFWYRQASVDLFTDSLLLAGYVTNSQPPPTTPGSVTMLLDLKGRLQYLRAVLPRIRDTEEAGQRPPAWDTLLRAAGFDASTLRTVAPSWVPPVYADVRQAWDGVYPDRPDIAVHIEAAEAHGLPVYFQIFEPWSPQTLAPPAARSGITAGAVFALAIVALLLAGGILLARRNLRLGRGDRAGAARVAVVLGSALALAGLITAHHTFEITGTLVLLFVLAARAALAGLAAYLVYVALEPDVRRRSPETLVSWSRAITGRWTDPLVGRDVLAGMALGVILQLVEQVGALAPGWIGHAPTLSVPPVAFDGTLAHVLATILVQMAACVLSATTLLLAYVVIFSATGRRAIATALFILALLGLQFANNGWTLATAAGAAGAALIVLGLARVGLLTVIVGLTAQNVLDQIPLTFDVSSFWGPSSYAVLALVIGISAVAARATMAGRPLIAGDWGD